MKVLEGAFREGDTVDVGVDSEGLTFTVAKPVIATA